MSSIDPSAAQTALFEKLGISKNTDVKKAALIVRAVGFFKADDHSVAKSGPVCSNG